MFSRTRLIPYLLLALVAFLLNFLWESAHAVLYTGYGNLGAPLPLSVWASLGDVLYITGTVLAAAFAKRRLDWFLDASRKEYALLAALGFFIAWWVEYKAFAAHTWAYTAAMPVIPGLNIGLSPVLQMMLLLPLSVFVTKFMYERLLERYR